MLVSWIVDVMTVVDSPIWLVMVIVLSNTDVETPVLVEVAGAEVMLTFSPPLGRTAVELVSLVHTDHVWLLPAEEVLMLVSAVVEFAVATELLVVAALDVVGTDVVLEPESTVVELLVAIELVVAT